MRVGFTESKGSIYIKVKIKYRESDRGNLKRPRIEPRETQRFIVVSGWIVLCMKLMFGICASCGRVQFAWARFDGLFPK